MKKFSNLLKENYITNIEDIINIVKEADELKGEPGKSQEDKSDDNTLDIKVPKEEQDDQQKEKKEYFFKNILFFTNERDPKKNKTLKNLEDAVKGKDIEIVTFVAEEVHYKSLENKILINDDKRKYTIDKQSNVDTICIVRLGVQDSEECMECIKEIQDWGIFVLNPIQSAKRASNKYQAAVLMERYDIPQPKFTLLCKNDIEKNQESLNKKLKDIYKDVGKDEEEDKKREYVVKILDGHGGTGVTMQTGKTMLSMLQMVFAIDEERELLCQKKEEADGGDIRVHVLTMRTEQKIIAAMKRKKLNKSDFRSNVSLGAEAEPIELTKEQEEIALKVAKISGMPWCAVDIMPLVEGSNDDFKDVGYNVVLEYNSSPGSEGISEVIGENFMERLLDNINDINELVLFPKSIGYLEDITFTMENEEEITFEAKLDTGNGAHASTIGCEKVEVDGDNVTATIEGKVYNFKKSDVTSTAIVGQTKEERTVVKIPCIQIGTRKLLDADFALVDNRNKKQKVLLNRDLMSKLAYMVNPRKKHLLIDEFADLKVIDKTKK